MHNDELRRWQLRDPAALLAEIADTTGLQAGISLLVLVEDAPTSQLIRDLTHIAIPPVVEWYDESRPVAEAAMRRLGLEQWGDRGDPARWPTAVPILVRRGRCVVRRGDLAVTNALRYANGFSAFVGSPLLVTPSGWCDILEDFGAAEPCCLP